MTEYKRDLNEDLKIMTLCNNYPNTEPNMINDVVAPHALRRAIVAEMEVERLTAENTEKDAAIEELRDINEGVREIAREWHAEAKHWKGETDGLRKTIEQAMNEYTNGQGPNTGVSHRMYKVLNMALGKGDNPNEQ